MVSKSNFPWTFIHFPNEEDQMENIQLKHICSAQSDLISIETSVLSEKSE